MAGEHQGHHLVADLAVGECLPRLAAGADQQAEDVLLTGVGLGAAAGDLAEDDLIEHGARGDHLAPGRARAAQQAQREVDPVEAEGTLEVLGGDRALAGAVGIEPKQSPHRNPHRQVAHPGVDVDDLAGLKPRDRRLGLDTHRLQHRRDLLAVEGGHHDRPGAVVVVVVDRQQTVAEQRDQVAEAALAPVEVLRVRDGDEVVGLRAEHEDAARVKEAEAEDRPVLLITGEQDRQRVTNDLLGAGDAEVPRARREPAAAAPLGDAGRRPAAAPGWRTSARGGRPALRCRRGMAGC